MYRQTLIKIPSRGLSRRAFSTTIRAMSAGDTGAPNKLGSLGGQGDAFQKREKANEDYSIRQREKEKLLELRKKLREQQDHLQKLSDHIDELTKDQGGEHN
ncbi:ATPase inhibitor, mitochondrial [Daldinia childiae]|uniref:ATPase inhibitor, mitochondrial n=1 Tax=Daldinia childiae TaxID=326645 RepID=UPI001446AF45|nr:ATPase inhibitor, mitochondrial [Daldinia childiae]KAF3061450.1 ATPase inhibitor, mitochondrial [Daldinia childiae]